MLEIKNIRQIPIDIVLSSIDHPKDSISITIPAEGSFSSTVDMGCTKNMKVLMENTLLWEGMVPTCISDSIIIDSLNKKITYKDRNIVGTVYNNSFFESINSTHLTIAIVAALVVIGIYLYKKSQK